MQTNRSLNKIASIKIIHKLYQDGLLNDNAFVAAKKVLRPVSAWFQWANRLLLFFGATLVLSGIIFFFAYNWAEMGKFLKFGLIELSIIGCILASCFRGLDQFSGKTLIFSASVLTGVLFAVYGQIYQTGADAYELFRGWAFLIAAWVVISEFVALWFLWLIIVNTGAILFWQQAGLPGHAIRYEWLCLAIALINSLALVLRETGLRNGLKWLAGKWFQAILLTAVLVALSIPSIHLIVASNSSYNGPSIITGLAFGIWVLVALASYLCYRYKLREMIPIAIIVMNGCVILLIFIGRILFYKNHTEAGIALLFALIILGVVSGAAFWLKAANAVITVEGREVSK
jgi:uncharacterized membrane protein